LKKFKAFANFLDKKTKGLNKRAAIFEIKDRARRKIARKIWLISAKYAIAPAKAQTQIYILISPLPGAIAR